MTYRTCPTCGAALDPGEPCDCRETITLSGKAYPITGRIKVAGLQPLPIVEMPMMADKLKKQEEIT